MEGGDVEVTAPVKEQEVKEEAPQTEPVPFIDDDEEEGYSPEEYDRFVELYERTLSEIKEGQIVMGRVLAVSQQDVLVDIGFKSEGTVGIDEFGDPPVVNVGDQIEVFLETIEDNDGQMHLSKKKANFMRLWDKVVDVFNEGGTIDGTCTRRIKGGMVCDLMGVDAFLPGSQIDVKPIRDFDALIGQTMEFKVVKVNRLRKNIVVSRRVLLEESMKEQRAKVLETLEKGKIFEGSVKNITDFGVFVDLGGVDGLLHINDLSWGRIKHPSEVVKLDEKINIMVLDFNDAKDRISLGLKQLQAHPWEGIEEKYPEKSTVTGKVVSITDYGAFVELERGVEGLIHVSEMSWTRHGIHPSKVVSVGEEIEVMVLNVDRDRKRISLGLKQLSPDPWDDIETKYPSGSKYTGRVRNMTNFGAFVEMEEGIDGLIHISDLSWTKKIKHPSEVLKKGDEVNVVILDVNKKDRRVSLGFKQLSEDPWPGYADKYKVATLVKANVIRFVDKGVVVELGDELEGFVPLSQFTETSMAQIQTVMNEGKEVELVVIEFDRDNKRIVLSHKKIGDNVKATQVAEEKTDVESYMDQKSAPETIGEMIKEKMAEAAANEPVEEEKPKAKPKKKAVKPKAKKKEVVEEEPIAEEPKAEEPKAEEPKAEEPKAEEPKAEEPKAEEPKAEEPKAEEPKAEEPKAEVAEEEAAKDAPAE
ncbi:30S ribosomal protein S1 [bacterium]|nr:30S ribosomal protein S1 [bacterium]